MARSYRVGSSGIVIAMCDAIRLIETIDASVQWDKKQCHLSPGTRVKARLFFVNRCDKILVSPDMWIWRWQDWNWHCKLYTLCWL